MGIETSKLPCIHIYIYVYPRLDCSHEVHTNDVCIEEPTNCKGISYEWGYHSCPCFVIALLMFLPNGKYRNFMRIDTLDDRGVRDLYVDANVEALSELRGSGAVTGKDRSGTAPTL